MKKLFLLHGALGSTVQFHKLRKFLPQFDLHVLNFDGHGGNEINFEFSIDRFVKNIFQYLEKEKINRCNFFGYSMGRYVALKFASLYPKLSGDIMTLGTKFDWNKESAEKE